MDINGLIFWKHVPYIVEFPWLSPVFTILVGMGPIGTGGEYEAIAGIIHEFHKTITTHDHGIFALLYISDFPGYLQSMLRIPYISLETKKIDAAVGGNSPGFLDVFGSKIQAWSSCEPSFGMCCSSLTFDSLNILWMEEILHQLVYGWSHCDPIIYSVL